MLYRVNGTTAGCHLKKAVATHQSPHTPVLMLCAVQIRFWGIDSGIRHSVGGSDYRSVRVGAFMGLKLISQTQHRQQQLLLAQPSSSVAAVLTEVTSSNRTPSPAATHGGSGSVGGADAAAGHPRMGAGAGAVSTGRTFLQHQQQHRMGGGGFFDAVPANHHQPQRQQADSIPSPVVSAEGAASGSSSSSRCMPSSFGGYLANISPSEYKELYESELPAALTGAEFLRTYGPHLDTATTVDAGTLYAVRDPTVHPIQENHRWGFAGRIVGFLVHWEQTAANEMEAVLLLVFLTVCSAGHCNADV